MKPLILPAALAFIAWSALAMPARSAEEHGHCSGANVCKGDKACETRGYKELTKEACALISGAKFQASSHAGESHKDEKHDHKKK